MDRREVEFNLKKFPAKGPGSTCRALGVESRFASTCNARKDTHLLWSFVECSRSTSE